MLDQPQGDLRGLKALVGILGVLIVLGTALVIGVVIHRLYARVSVPPSMAALPAPGLASATLAPGERIAGIAAAGPDLAIWISSPNTGDRVMLFNPATGQFSTVLSAAK